MKSTWVKVNGTWKQVKNVWTKINGVWKQRVMPKGKISGSWRELMSYGRYNIYNGGVTADGSYKIKFPYSVIDPSYNNTEIRTLVITPQNSTDGLVTLGGITHINPSEGIVALLINTNRSTDRNEMILIIDLIQGKILKHWETQRKLGVGSRGIKSNGKIITVMYETFNKETNLKVFDLNLNELKDTLITRSGKVSNYILRRDGGIYFIDYNKLIYMGPDYQMKKEVTLPWSSDMSLDFIDKDENVYVLTLYADIYKYSSGLGSLGMSSHPESGQRSRFIDHEGKIVEELWNHVRLYRKDFDGSLLWERATSSSGLSFLLDTNGNYLRDSQGEVIGSAKGNIIKEMPLIKMTPLTIQGNFI